MQIWRWNIKWFFHWVNVTTSTRDLWYFSTTILHQYNINNEQLITKHYNLQKFTQQVLPKAPGYIANITRSIFVSMSLKIKLDKKLFSIMFEITQTKSVDIWDRCAWLIGGFVVNFWQQINKNFSKSSNKIVDVYYCNHIMKLYKEHGSSSKHRSSFY